MSASTIFAKVGVDLVHHHRLLRIPAELRAAALGTWLAALLVTRGQELDGWCPAEALAPFVQPDVLQQLASSSLLVAEIRDGVSGFRVERYADHNETAAEIALSKRKDRLRKRKARCPPGFRSDSERSHASFPASASASVSDSEDPDLTRAREPDSVPPAAPVVRLVPELPAVALEPPTDRARELAAGVAMVAGPFDVEDAWFAYLTSTKHRSDRSWQNWCAHAARFAKRDRQRERDRPRGLHAPPVPDMAEHERQAFAADGRRAAERAYLQRRVAEAKAGGE